jgi:DNA-binding MarR family transcriptional regulator
MSAPSSEPRDRGVQAWGALLKVHADLVPLLDRQLQRTVGLPLAWYDVLLELNAAPNRRLRMGELGEKVVLSRTRVSRLVDELTRAGLVTRTSNPDDRRSAYAQLTPHGRNRLRSAAPVYLAGIGAHFTRHLTDAEIEVLAGALARVHDAHEGLPETLSPSQPSTDPGTGRRLANPR